MRGHMVLSHQMHFPGASNVEKHSIKPSPPVDRSGTRPIRSSLHGTCGGIHLITEEHPAFRIPSTAHTQLPARTVSNVAGYLGLSSMVQDFDPALFNLRAARQGFEPQLTDPESVVLPLDDRAIPD